MMIMLGFDEQWVYLVMMCANTVKYTVNQNGYEIGPVKPNKSLRKGGLLSRCLFILCAEGLLALFNTYVFNELIHGC